MATESTGHRIFRTALLAESTLNVASMIPMLLAPDTVLSYIVKSPSNIMPLSKSLLQWTGAIITLATAPLLLSYPNPKNPGDSTERAAIVARRRHTYAIMGITEVALAATTAWQYLRGDSGLTDSMLLIATASVGGLSLARGWVLTAGASYLEPPTGERKTR